MGNYLTIGAKFKPYSFEEMIRPYQMYGLAYKELEMGLEDLATKSSIWEGLTNNNTDPLTHAAYEKYANDINAQANQLAKEGLNATNRQLLSLLKQRYGKEIVPIELAYALRKQLIDLDTKLRQLAMMSGSVLYSDRPDLLLISLDEIMKNPNVTPQYETLASRIANAAKMALTLAKQENGQSKWETTAGGQLIERKTSMGLTQKELTDAANGKSTHRVEALINQAIESSGSNKWSNVDKNQLRSDVIQGLYAGVGESKDEIHQNQNYIDPIRAKQLLYQLARIDALKNPNGPVLSGNYTGLETGATQNKESLKGNDIFNGFKVTKTENGIASIVNSKIIDINKKIADLDKNISEPPKQSKIAGAIPIIRGPEVIGDLQTQRANLIKERTQELDKMNKFHDKYSYLGLGYENNVKLGAQLEKNQSEQSNIEIPLILKGDKLNAVLKNIENMATVSGGQSIYKYNDKGEKESISNKEMSQLFSSDPSNKNPIKVISVDRNRGFKLTDSLGNKYSMDGITPFKNMDKHITKISNYLATYNRHNISKPQDVSRESLTQALLLNDIKGLAPYLKDLINENSVGGIFKTVDKQGNIDYVKVVYDFSSNVPKFYKSSLSDEANGSGQLRNRDMNGLAIESLQNATNIGLGENTESSTYSRKDDTVNTDVNEDY